MMLDWRLLASVAVLTLYACFRFVLSVKRNRDLYKGKTGVPHDPIWGHLRAMGDYMKDDRHVDYAVTEMWKDNGRPPFFFIDVYPVSTPNLCIIADAALAERLFKSTPEWPYSFPKPHTFSDLKSVIGPSSMLWVTGEQWKTLRKRYNPGFSSRHLQGSITEIVQEVKKFVNILESDIGSVVTLGDLTTALTIDIIATVVLGHSVNAQSGTSRLNYGFTGCMNWQLERERLNPFHLFNPLRPVMLAYYEWHLNRAIDVEIKGCFQNRDQLNAKSVMALTLAEEKSDALSSAALALARDQVKTFLMAGHDTTSTALQWIYYELSVHPHMLSKLRKEHESIFGALGDDYKDYEERVERLFSEQPDDVLQKLVYSAALLKEALRLHPIAAGSKVAPTGSNVTAVDDAGNTQLLDNHTMMAAHVIIGIDEKLWGPDAHDFNPDRWMPDAEWKFPPYAFRCFERGPRSCIGQELAYMEAKVILAFTVQRFEFEKVFDTKYKELYNVRKITAKPNDGMRMRVLSAQADKHR